MRVVYVALVFWIFAGDGHANERSASLVNSFQVMCTLEPLDFARSEAKAAAMGLRAQQDLRSPPDASGGSVRSRSWLLPLKTGSHEFTIAGGRGPKGEVKSCGIAAVDADAKDFKAELVKAMKLGSPIAEGLAPDGIHLTTVWRYGSDGIRLQLTDRSPRSFPGVYLLLLQAPL